jgi:membrane dipeptidase
VLALDKSSPNASMSTSEPLSRREFTKVAAGMIVLPSVASRVLESVTGTAGTPHAWPRYEQAMVVDFLASPGPFNTPVDVEALTPAMVSNARASGITAVNLTIGGSNPEQVFQSTARWERDLERHPDALMKVRTTADLSTARQQRKLGLIYGFQDGVAIDAELSRVALYHAFGLRIVQLTYNVRNMFGDGCLQPENGGLTPLGRQLVEALNATGITVDLAHCGMQTTADAIEHSSRPVAISHSGCRAVADRPRSKPDNILKRMADKGGVVGIYLMPFLTMGGQPTSDDLVRHIEHAINVCGEEHVGIGSDLSITPHVVDAEYMNIHRTFVEGRIKAGIAAPGEDAAVPMFVTDLNTPRRMEQIADKLLARKHPESRVEKVIGQNFVRLMRETWG